MKYHPHDSVLFITFSIEEGLLLLCNPLCQAIIKGCLARAQHLYPVKICHLLVESTHVHLILVVDDPADVPAFIRHFKTESAHLLNRIVGRKKRTVWCEGYDSPIILTPIRALLAIVYLYLNPSKDNLVGSIEHYPGFSTWKMFQSNRNRRKWKRIPRRLVRTLSKDSLNPRGYAAEASRVLALARVQHDFILEPNAWMEAFGIIDPLEQARWNERIVSRLRTMEDRCAEKRRQFGKTVMGAPRLLQQTFNLVHRPERQGRRTICLTEDRSLRKKFLQLFRDLMNRARSVSRAWKLGDFSLPFPSGLYPPSFPKLSEPLSVW